jgi:hypothetical protein
VDRRVFGAVAGGVAVAAMLSGCLIAIDAAKPVMHFTNDSSQDVVVVVEGFSSEFPDLVASQNYYTYGLSKCEGTGMRVETVSGEFIGRVKAQACPNWTLTINEDGSLDYVKDK